MKKIYFLLLTKYIRFTSKGGVDEDAEYDDDEGGHQVRAKQGAPIKCWDSLGPHQKRLQSQKVFDELKKTASARNIEPARLTGTLLHRYYLNEDLV